MINIAAIIVVMLANPSFAAPALKSNICYLEGKIVSIQQRTVNRDKGWANSWGVKPYVSYNDVTVEITKSKNDSSGFSDACTETLQTFQVRDSEMNKVIFGSQIRAKAQYSGDEFMIGNWLFDIEHVFKR